MLITAVIPTKNRPADLARAVISICSQERLPDELLIVDQSPGDASRIAVEAALKGSPLWGVLNYVHDSGIRGLVAAKAEAVRRARGELVCFLEDDIVLEPDYVAQIERGFLDRPGMLGCCGVVANLPPLPAGYIRMFHFFHRGIFRDVRVGVHGLTSGRGLPLIPSDYLSGGLSAYRREVFDSVGFDLGNDFFMLEDIDFSTRAAQRFGKRFFINPNARLEHRMSALNRAVLGSRQRRKLREFLVFYKKRRASGRLPTVLLLLAGLLLEAGYQALRSRTPSPVIGYFLGLWDGVFWTLARDSQ